MHSIASWSPSQSEPLTVSYMCHSQLSSDMLPSDAPMPPCAATVCDRVGNTFDNTATERPASESCNDARMPAPPAPTTIASNFRTGSEVTSALSPREFARAMQHRRPERRTSPLPARVSRRLADVVHPDVAHSDPG